MWFRNTNAMSPVIKFVDGGKAVLSYITTGGQVHAYFFTQGSAKEIISLYQSLVGKPRLPPYWSLGWHASSYSYQTFDMVRDNVVKYNENKIPLDGIWFDIPYMEQFASFTVDT